MLLIVLHNAIIVEVCLIETEQRCTAFIAHIFCSVKATFSFTVELMIIIYVRYKEPTLTVL